MNSTNGRCLRWTAAGIVITGSSVGAMFWPGGDQAFANPGSGIFTMESQLDGFDGCAQSSTSSAQMQDIWNNELWAWISFIEIGGEAAACPGLGSPGGATWVSQVYAQGWHFVPYWVGLQAPCNGYGANSMSTNTSTAFKQGVDDASSAESAVVSLGFAAPTVIFDDMEGYGHSTCLAEAQASVNQYVSGWDEYLTGTLGDSGGVYGSSCDSYVSNWAGLGSGAVPPDVWLADLSLDQDSTFGYPCVSNGLWTNAQRHGQYEYYTLPEIGKVVDRDAAYGVVAP